MRTFAARVQKLRRIVIPKDIAEELGIKQGDWVEVTVRKLTALEQEAQESQMQEENRVFVPREAADSSGMFKCPKCGSGMYIYGVSKQCKECGSEFIY